ncbi:MAG TPA: hypothetical protein DCE41_27610 [Cytophagales bacterium]|nr:hypothetical protein [Cytophagales bacterium]HAA20996.1 hypothetical protein [Cytophagales bacterium]HAP61529.1 hypothetical protein [Cytophagales bacterium]
MILMGTMLFYGASAQLIVEKPVFRYTWHRGVVINAEQQVIRGEVMLNYEKNLVMVRSGETTTTLSPIQTTFIQFYDEELGVNRDFVPLVQANNLPRPAFFEVVVKGNLALLRREKMVNTTSQVYESGNEIRTIFTPVKSHDYYLYNHERLRLLTSYRRDLLPFIRSRKQDIEGYVKENSLQVATLQDQIEIIHYFNTIEN